MSEKVDENPGQAGLSQVPHQVGAAGAADGRHYSGTYTRLIVSHVEAVLGSDGAAELLRQSAQTQRLHELLDDASWSSYEQFRSLLEAAASMLADCGGLDGITETAVLEAGSMPGATDALLLMGSPGALLSELNANTAGTTTVEETFTTQRGPTSWHLGWRSIAGTAPFEALCMFHVATTKLLPRLFGCSNVEAAEVTCQRRGDEWCTIAISWEEAGGVAQQAQFLAMKLALAERRLEVFERTVAQVVGSAELEPALRQVVASAAGALRAPSFVLALDPLPWPAKRAYGYGISDEEAERVAATGGSEADLIVEVASGRYRHGKLIALGANRSVPVPMQDLLQAYAQLAASALDGARAVEEARRQAATAGLLLELASRLGQARTLQEVADTLALAVPGLIDCDRAVIALVDGSTATPVAVHGYSAIEEEMLIGVPIPLEGKMSPEVVYYDRGQVDAENRALMEATGSLATVMVPIFVEGEGVAWISADVTQDPSRLAPSAALEERLQGLAAQTTTAVHNTMLLERVSYQAHHDALTGLPNRKFLTDRLQELSPATSAMLFVDLDDFKLINDGFGHHAGDTVLSVVADRLRNAVRADDIVARLAGDEFAILMTDADDSAAEAVAQRVLEAFEHPISVGDTQVSVRASVGLAAGRTPPEELLRTADAAMYRAKAAGKARLVTERHTDDPPTS